MSSCVYWVGEAEAGCSLRNTDGGLRGSEASNSVLLFTEHLLIEDLLGAGMVVSTENRQNRSLSFRSPYFCGRDTPVTGGINLVWKRLRGRFAKGSLGTQRKDP